MAEENTDDVYVEEESSAQTFVTLRADYSANRSKARRFYDTTFSYQKTDGKYIRHDPVKGMISLLVKKVEMQSKSLKTRVEQKKMLYVPSLGSKGRGKNFSRDVVLELFGSYTFDFAVVIGVDPDRIHYSYDGRNAITYQSLFEYLEKDGYDPLAPLHDPNTIERLQRQLAAYIYDTVQNMRKGIVKGSSVKRQVEKWARNIRDYVRDYIRGGVPAIPKDRPEPSTVYERRWKQKKNPGLYKYGLMNSLWETGQLEMAIDVLDVRPISRIIIPPKKKSIIVTDSFGNVNSNINKTLEDVASVISADDIRSVREEIRSMESDAKKIVRPKIEDINRKEYEKYRSLVFKQLEIYGFKGDAKGIRALNMLNPELVGKFLNAASVLSGKVYTIDTL